MKFLLEMIGNVLIIVFGIWSLLMFILMWRYGKSIFVEPHYGILTFETILAIVIIGFGIERIIDDIRRHK